MRQFFYCLNCAVAIILLINSVNLAAAGLPWKKKNPVILAPPPILPFDEAQYELNAHVGRGKEFTKQENWVALKRFNIQGIILYPIEGRGKDQRTLQIMLEKFGFLVEIPEIPVFLEDFARLCRSESSGHKLLLGNDHLLLRAVFLRQYGCVVAVHGPKLLINFTLRSVAIIEQPKLEAWLIDEKQSHGLEDHLGPDLTMYLVKGGAKAVVVKNAVFPGKSGAGRYPKVFETFAKILDAQGLRLYIERDDGPYHRRDFYDSSISRTFYRQDGLPLLSIVKEATVPEEIFVLGTNREEGTRLVLNRFLSLWSGGGDKFEWKALDVVDPSIGVLPPPRYVAHQPGELPPPFLPPPSYQESTEHEVYHHPVAITA